MRRYNVTPLLLGLGFGAQMSVVALAYLWLVVFQPEEPRNVAGIANFWSVVRTYALPFLPAAALSWWIITAGVRQPRALASGLYGAMAGLLSVFLGALSISVAILLHMWQSFALLGLSFPFLSAIFIIWPIITPQGLGADMVAVVGALYCVAVSRYLVVARVAPAASR